MSRTLQISLSLLLRDNHVGGFVECLNQFLGAIRSHSSSLGCQCALGHGLG